MGPDLPRHLNQFVIAKKTALRSGAIFPEAIFGNMHQALTGVSYYCDGFLT
jgi:hypothetical protein